MVNKKPLKFFKKHFRPTTNTKYNKVKRSHSTKNANLINQKKALTIDIPTHFYDLSSTAPIPGRWKICISGSSKSSIYYNHCSCK